jgi:hypothetical protein
VKTATWNVDHNTVGHLRTLTPGSLTPTGFAQGRWVDFIDAISPIAGSASLVVGGTVAVPSVNSTQGATLWATVVP